MSAQRGGTLSNVFCALCDVLPAYYLGKEKWQCSLYVGELPRQSTRFLLLFELSGILCVSWLAASLTKGWAGGQSQELVRSA